LDANKAFDEVVKLCIGACLRNYLMKTCLYHLYLYCIITYSALSDEKNKAKCSTGVASYLCAVYVDELIT